MELQRIKRNSFPLVGSIFNDFFNNDTFLNNNWVQQTLPAVNIQESDQAYKIELAAPGMTKEDFNVEIDDNVLTISAEKEINNETEDQNFTRKEFSFNKFSRRFTLPENINLDQIKGDYKDGVLNIELPKLEEKVEKKKLISIS